MPGLEEMVSFKDFSHKVVHLPVYITSNMILNNDPRIPYLGKHVRVHIPNKKNPESWRLTVDNARRFFRLIENLPENIKSTIQELKKTLTDPVVPLEKLIGERKLLTDKTRRFIHHPYVAMISRYSYQCKASQSNEMTMCVTSAFTHDTGEKVCDHAWFTVRNTSFVNLQLIKPNEYIRFDAKSVIYKKIDKETGEDMLCMGFGYVRNIKQIPIPELKKWKDSILQKRNNRG